MSLHHIVYKNTLFWFEVNSLSLFSTQISFFWSLESTKIHLNINSVLYQQAIVAWIYLALKQVFIYLFFTAFKLLLWQQNPSFVRIQECFFWQKYLWRLADNDQFSIGYVIWHLALSSILLQPRFLEICSSVYFTFASQNQLAVHQIWTMCFVLFCFL